MDMDYIYLPFDVPQSNLRNALKGIIALGVKGFNVTIPHKESLISFLANVSEEASIVGSVNTVVNDMGRLVGYNTDVNGVYETLIPYKDEIAGNVVSVIGAGGAARAAIYSLIRHLKPSSINIINRTEQRAESLKNYFSTKMKFENFKTFELFPPDLIPLLQSSKVIINATSVGMFPDIEDSVINLPSAFTKGQIVFDMVYNPHKTTLLKIAEGEGAIVLNGISMLVHQAAKAFELWTNNQMPVDEIRNSLIQYIAE
jgi:shikimate dehydrogenase